MQAIYRGHLISGADRPGAQLVVRNKAGRVVTFAWTLAAARAWIDGYFTAQAAQAIAA
jgi:hypothetical protein